MTVLAFRCAGDHHHHIKTPGGARLNHERRLHDHQRVRIFPAQLFHQPMRTLQLTFHLVEIHQGQSALHRQLSLGAIFENSIKPPHGRTRPAHPKHAAPLREERFGPVRAGDLLLLVTRKGKALHAFGEEKIR